LESATQTNRLSQLSEFGGHSGTDAPNATPDFRLVRSDSVKFAESSEKGRSKKMSILFVIIAIVAIVLAITGGLVHALNFLLWVGIVLLILAVIAFLIRSISGRRV
jgi:small-conductance mechanosensitive channel